MSTPRKIKRKKQLAAKKAAKKKSKEVSLAISKMSKTCSVCNREFDKTDKQMIQTWMISVYDNGESILTCETCSSKTANLNETS